MKGPLHELLNNDDSSAVVNIKDQGSGIPKKILARIGEPFFTTKKNGTGLGGMVSLELMKHHNRAVHIESNSMEQSFNSTPYFKT